MALADVLIRPAFLWTPPYVTTAAEDVVGLAEALGYELDAEQVQALEVLLGETESGDWAAFEACVICSRQNLKTFLLQLIVLTHLFVWETPLVIWSAHEFATTLEAFRWFVSVIESKDWLLARVRSITRANGKELIELHNGCRLVFRARTKSGGRGLTGNVVVLDEAFALTADIMGSLLPTLSAVPNPQVLYGSSAGRAESDVLRSVRDRGRSGVDESLAYIEWCCTRRCDSERCDHRVGSPGCRLDDESAWADANPAIGRRISVDYIRKERRALPPSEFARERLGWWDEPGGALEGLPVEVWTGLRDSASHIVGAPVFAAVIAHDLTWACVAVAAHRSDKLPHLEVIDYRPATGWVADRCRGLLADFAGSTLVVESGGPRSSLLDDLDDLGVAYTQAAAKDLVEGCGQIEDRVRRGSVRHIGQPELDIAVAVAKKRVVGDAWTWARRASNADVSPIVAVTLALWGLKNAQPQLTGLFDPNDYDD